MKISSSKERIKELMGYFGISQTELCNKTGLQKSALSNYLNGDREPRQDQISIIVDPFNVNPAWLMGYDVSMFLNIESAAAASDQPAAPASLSVAPVQLTSDESELLSKYKRLNEEGKKEVHSHTDYILSQDRFLKDSGIPEEGIA